MAISSKIFYICWNFSFLANAFSNVIFGSFGSKRMVYIKIVRLLKTSTNIFLAFNYPCFPKKKIQLVTFVFLEMTLCNFWLLVGFVLSWICQVFIFDFLILDMFLENESKTKNIWKTNKHLLCIQPPKMVHIPRSLNLLDFYCFKCL